MGVQVRRFARARLQNIEADLWVNQRVWGGELRVASGFGIRDTGLYATVGGATSRVGAYTPGTLTQVTYGLETSILWRPKP